MADVFQISEYPPEKVFQAQDLYCVDRLTYAATADKTGVSIATIKRWSDKYGWREKREELAKAEADIRFDTVKARAKMLEALINKPSAPNAFGVAALENLALQQDKHSRETNQALARQSAQAIDINDPKAAITALEQAIQQKLALILSDPSAVDFKTVSDIRKALELVAEMKGREAATDEDKHAGLSLESEAKIKKFLTEGL